VLQNLLSPRGSVFFALACCGAGGSIWRFGPAQSFFSFTCLLATAFRGGVDCSKSGLGFQVWCTVFRRDGDSCWCRSTALFCAQAGARPLSMPRRSPATYGSIIAVTSSRRRAFFRCPGTPAAHGGALRPDGIRRRSSLPAAVKISGGRPRSDPGRGLGGKRA